jgi:UDP-4-amino-4,6-dideoxy-N-acetyl-beta-L-altrosamine transaminase
MKRNIPYGKQQITEDDTKAVVDALHSDFLTQGPRIAEFESNFANYVGSKYAIAVSNGTAALHLPLLAAGIQQGDNVITTPITFAASANAALYCGANVHFVDIDPDTYIISIEGIKQLLAKHPKGFFKAIIPVDFCGYPVNMEEIKALATEHGMFVLEDACHAPGAYFIDSKKQIQKAGNGNYADAVAFSFHPVKHIAAGEGGMITTNNEELYKKLLMLRSHGITKENLQYDFPEPDQQGAWYYEMKVLGYNYRITDIQAALANSQLKRADEGIAKRHQIADKYRAAFENVKAIKMQAHNPHFFNALHLFVIEVNNRKELYEYLQANGIYAQIHYVPVHLMPHYKTLGWKVGDFPIAENYYKHCISLPMYPSLTAEEQDYVVDKISAFYL